jgi:hypothetical protein
MIGLAAEVYSNKTPSFSISDNDDILVKLELIIICNEIFINTSQVT